MAPKSSRASNHHIDSTIWNDFAFRDDDIVIASYARSGTAWVQQIVSQLLLPGAEGLDVAAMSPWLDRRVPPKAVTLPAIEAQTHRRFLQTHLPVDALVYAPRAKYIYVGRDGRDVVWSLRDHHVNDLWYGSLNDTPGRVVPPIGWPAASIRQSFLDWMERDDPFWPFWGHVRSWWEIRRLPNLLFLHFAGLEADLPGQVRRIAGFLDIPIDESRWPFILEHCSFDSMKAHASGGVRLWDGDAGACVTRARPGSWRDTLTADDCRRYEQTARRRLGEACARWLATGERIDEAPGLSSAA